VDAGAAGCLLPSLLVIAEIFRAQPPLISTKYDMIGTRVLKLRDHPNRCASEKEIR